MSAKLTREQAIDKFIAKHGDRYDYSEVVYSGSHDKVKIICEKHGVFEQEPTNHMAGKGCPACRVDSCVAARTTPIETIKSRLAQAHGLKYIYYLEGITNWQKITFVCPTHGKASHWLPWHLKNGCVQCMSDYYKRKNSQELTWEELVQHIDADITTGEIRHRVAYRSKKAGDPFNITIDSKGYQVCSLMCRTFYVHRVIWSFAHGRLLDEDLSIDHINSVPSDNRISNLRAVTHMDNQHNMALRKDNKTGVCGVRYLAKENIFVAHITANKKVTYLGRFRTLEAATTARKAAEVEMDFHPNHGMPRHEKAKR